MSEYINKVVNASGEYAAPVDTIEEEETEERKEAPEGYHYMPDGELMKDSAHEAAALEKESDDPCWKGYVQVGMKKKNGKKVPNCVPSAASIDEIVASVNSEFGHSRRVREEDAYQVARKACDKYSYLGDTEELELAILWEVFTYVEYATEGVSEDLEDLSEYSILLPAGHPGRESSIADSLEWVYGAPDLDDFAKEALLSAFDIGSGGIEVLHATTRLEVLMASGGLSEVTVSHLEALKKKHTKDS
jgi:hypothetical protein